MSSSRSKLNKARMIVTFECAEADVHGNLNYIAPEEAERRAIESFRGYFGLPIENVKIEVEVEVPGKEE